MKKFTLMLLACFAMTITAKARINKQDKEYEVSSTDIEDDGKGFDIEGLDVALRNDNSGFGRYFTSVTH